MIWPTIQSIRYPSDPSEELLSEWGKPGNLIVSYGPIMEPYRSTTKNSYSLHSPDGKQIDMVSGDGAYSPDSFPTRGGSYLYFPDRLRQVGEHTGVQTIAKYDPISFGSESPVGNYSVAVINASGAEKFVYQIVLLREDGQTFSTKTEIQIHSLASSPDYTLLIGDTEKGRRLLALDLEGNLKEIPFPAEYDIYSPDFVQKHVSYLGGDRFEILQGNQVEDSAGNLHTDFISFEIEYGKEHRDSTTAVSTTHYSKVLPADVKMHYALKHGDSVYVRENGDVYIHERLKNSAYITGNIGTKTKKEMVPVFSYNTDPLFGLEEEDGSISLRKWHEPEKIITTIPKNDWACKLEECGIGQISIIN